MKRQTSYGIDVFIIPFFRRMSKLGHNNVYVMRTRGTFDMKD